jgi:hypothetical protein
VETETARDAEENIWILEKGSNCRLGKLYNEELYS